MLGLSKARMPDLVAALEEARSLHEEPTGIPRRSKRVARLMMREAIRLIRLGTRSEITDAALELSKARKRSLSEGAEEFHSFSQRMLTSACDALTAASPPSSGGGEMTLLRSWNGKAKQAVSIVSQAQGRAIPRADLRVQLDVDESYLSHLLAELEAAGLIVRVRSGRTVMVHLGMVGRSDHVQELLPKKERVPLGKAASQERGPLRPARGDSAFMKTTETLRLDVEELVRTKQLDNREHIYGIDQMGEGQMTGARLNTGTVSNESFERAVTPREIRPLTRSLVDSASKA